MKTQPIVPARIDFDAGVPAAPDFGDIYHPRVGALEQARHVFLGGNRLPARWAGRERFVVVETGFGLGNNFLATWDAWRADPARPQRLVFASIERHPPTRADLERAHAGSALPSLAAALVAAWPQPTPNLHPIDFDGGRVHLLLALGDVAALLPELVVRADAFFLDGFAPARNPAMWEARVLKALGQRAAPDATLATWSVAGELRAGLSAAGFEVGTAPGIGGKREITVAQRRARGAPAGYGAAVPSRDAVVVGAGLAGAFCARALADSGWSVTLLDRRPAPATETSGNPAGLFHGTVHADDGPHARLLRAGALLDERLLRPLLRTGAVAGSVDGLLRVGGDLDAMRSTIDRQRLPPGWVQAFDAGQASAAAGVRLAGPAWFYPGGGWAAPADWVGAALGSGGVRFVGDAAVDALQRGGSGWRALAADGALLAEAAIAVVANAADARRLLAPFGAGAPLLASRGQVSGWVGAPTPLRLPLAGDGYALPLADGLLCGATSSTDDDDDGAPRAADDAANFERLRRLTGLVPPADPRLWRSRVGWRLTADDRLPLVGAVPQPLADGRADQPRLWPRIEGLYVCSALGGRGITLAPLLGRLLAALIDGGPLPVERSLADAVDPARWRVRALRRGRGGTV